MPRGADQTDLPRHPPRGTQLPAGAPNGRASEPLGQGEPQLVAAQAECRLRCEIGIVGHALSAECIGCSRGVLPEPTARSDAAPESGSADPYVDVRWAER